ncbi:NAD(P)-binding protein [Mytilinidion resinicola]|uniref:NAD(P)-binding protein n=1 Tax=Mytilinidion resinicola TaxID=574789 RepID=A0A6A6Y6W4_9PEZI|nr:NAD(P)-binding protein [Mytilinidion resinicola]KAF2804552.1 NAD(P)-binding protein [Mytilinidion resinicola]
MVKIAIAGGSGNVAQEIIDVLVASKKHEILLLSRNDAPAGSVVKGVTWIKANYEDPEQLAQILQGVHTVLSFVAISGDAASTIQRNLIDAAILAGVKRFAPSEWSTSGLKHLSWYAYKAEARQYLKELNKDKKVLEYSLFQPGLFLNYFTSPYKSSKHLHAMEIPFDFNNRRALVLDGGDDDRITITTVQDLANVVAKAIDFEGEWPVVSGIRGVDMSVREVIALGEKIRGAPFAIEKLKTSELESGEWKTSWIPRLDHPSIPVEQVDIFSRIIVAGVLLAISAKGYTCSDEWNQLLPDYKFTNPEEFFTEAWRGKQ